MNTTRSIPVLLPLLFAMACGSAKPASGPETQTGSASPAGDTSAGDAKAGDTKTDDATPDTAKADPEHPAADDKNKESKPGSPGPAEAGPPPPAAAAVEKPLSGGLSQDDIREIMMKNGALFDSCYKLTTDKSKQLVGTVKVQATIGPTGKVNEIKVLKSTMNNPKVDTCVTDAFRKIKFPAPSTGATSVITFPINFEGVEQVKK